MNSPLNPMNREYILCAETESILHPSLLGLEGESIVAQPWLKAFSDAQEARDHVRCVRGPLKAWVAGSDQMEAVNLAAAMRQDRPDADISLVCFTVNGSLSSRARVAGITQILDRAGFMRSYEEGKRAHLAKEACAYPQAPSPGLGNGLASSVAPVKPSVQLMPSGMPLPQSQAPGHASCAQSIGSSAVAGASQAVSSVPARAYVLTIVGAGGGTGKSSIATLCACYAQARGKKTLLLDADLQFGDLACLLGVESPLRIDELMESPLRVEGLSCNGKLPALLAAPKRLERSELVASCIPQIMELLRPRFDVIVVNTGASWGDSHISLLESSSNALFLIDQRPSSVRSCRHALELCSRCGIASQPFLFALNHCSKKALFSAADVSSALQGVRVFEFAEGGSVVEEQLGCGRPSDLVGCGNPLLQSIAAFMEEVLPGNTQAPESFSEPASPSRKWGWGRWRRR